MQKIALYTLLCFLLGGCLDGKVEAKLVDEVELNQTSQKTFQKNEYKDSKIVLKDKESQTNKIETFKPSKELQEKQKEQELMSRFYQILSDGAKISPKGKEMILIFGQPTDPYTKKVQKDIIEDNNLSRTIKDNLSPFYIDATKIKMHKFWHNGELIDVDTKTLVSIYGINSTPTIIFLDSHAKSILTVPGYMPPKQFIVTINFIKDKRYRGKDRKNGEIYRELKKYYIEHGIKIKDKK